MEAQSYVFSSDDRNGEALVVNRKIDKFDATRRPGATRRRPFLRFIFLSRIPKTVFIPYAIYGDSPCCGP